MDLNRGLSDENPTELRRIVGGAQRENYCDTGVAAREAWWPANSETPPFHKTVHQASIMQKGRGVALPRDIDPRANIDPFHPNTPSSHQVTSPSFALPRFSQLSSLFLFHLRIAFSCSSPLLYSGFLFPKGVFWFVWWYHNIVGIAVGGIDSSKLLDGILEFLISEKLNLRYFINIQGTGNYL